jgi:hypothetical protein
MLQETIVLTLAYILIVAIAFAPKCPQTVSPIGAVEYFPEIDDEPTAIATVTTSPIPTDLKTLTSKQLKAIARNQKIPKYGSLTKKQLLIALA